MQIYAKEKPPPFGRGIITYKSIYLIEIRRVRLSEPALTRTM